MPWPGCSGTLTCSRPSLHPAGKRQPARSAAVIPGQGSGAMVNLGYTAQPQGAHSTGMPQVCTERGASPPAAISSRCLRWDTSPTWPCSPPAAPARRQDAARALQAAWVLVLRWQSRVAHTCEGILPFTPLCVLPDFAPALTLLCSLDPAPAPGAPMAAA